MNVSERDANALRARFSGLVEPSLDALYAHALRLTRNGADAEDLVADAIAKAWAAFGTLEEEGRFRPWLFRILHNAFVSDFRRRRARPEALMPECDGEGRDEDGHEIGALLIQQPDDFLLWWANPEREFANRLLREDLVAAIESLPLVYRETVLLVNVEELTYDEAAEVLGVSPGTIRSRMNRGRTLLQKALWQHARDVGLVGEHRSKECEK